MARQINFGGYLIKQYGAYIRTDLTGLVDVNGVASGIIGMIGLAEKGPVGEAVTVNGYTELVETFGDGPLVRHGLAAYVGGASQIIAVRVGSPAKARLEAIDVSATDTVTDESDNYTFVAKEAGTLGNNISIAIEVQDQADLDTDNDQIAIRVRYIDARGNDVRETFVVPRYIPNPNLGGGNYLYFDGNTTDYYVLRNRDTGTVREVPGTWGYGNIDEQAFLDKVAALKSTDEDLVGPFPYGAGTNGYPMMITQAVINNGGLGQGPSQLVTLENVNPTMAEMLVDGFTYDPAQADVLIDHNFIPLSGGDNGDDGTNYYGFVATGGSTDNDVTFNRAGVEYDTVLEDSWGVGLNVLEAEEVNFVQPAYLFNYDGNATEWTNRYSFFKSVMPLFLAHINTLSNIPNRMFRSMVVGLPYYKKGSTANNTAADFLTAVQDISGTINNDRVQLWAGGFQSRAFSSSVEQYGGDMLASFVVGAHASREVSTSLTFARLSGIFTDGLEFSFNHSQKDELYERSLAFVMKRRNSTGAIEYVAAHNYTSFTGASSRGLQLFITRRIVDYMNSFVYKNLEENFIGQKSRGAETAGRISDFVTALLNRLVREDVLVAFDNVNVYPEANDKTIYNVEYDFQPVTEIDFIPVTNRLLYSLA